MNDKLPYSLKMTVIMCIVWVILVFGLCYFAGADVMRVKLNFPPDTVGPNYDGWLSAVYDPNTFEITAVAVMRDHPFSGIAGWDTEATGWVNPDEKTYRIESMGIFGEQAGYNGFPPRNLDEFSWTSEEPRLSIYRPRYSDPAFAGPFVGNLTHSEPVFVVPEPSAAALGLVGLICIFQQCRSRNRTRAR